MARKCPTRSSLAAAGALLLLIGTTNVGVAQLSKQPSTQGTEVPPGHGPDARKSGAVNPDRQPSTTGQSATSETTGAGNNINDDSYYATGSDLNGPAVRYLPASKTPE